MTTESAPGDGTRPPSGEPGGGDTTRLVRAARSGDQDSVGRLVSRLTPLLIAQAEYRLGRQLRRHLDPEDLVADVWAVSLPRLASLNAPDGREVPVLLRFLGTTLVYRVNNLARKLLRADAPLAEADLGNDDGSEAFLAGVPAEVSGVVTKAIAAERRSQVALALDALEDVDRQVVVLRGVEQCPAAVAGSLLGMSANTVSHRYRRALEKLRSRLPASVFEDLVSD